jgi:hypothetical protein
MIVPALRVGMPPSDAPRPLTQSVNKGVPTRSLGTIKRTKSDLFR